MPERLSCIVLSTVAALGLCACGGGVTEGSGDAVPAGQVDVFAERIEPILRANCGCHTGGSADGGVAVGSYAAAVGQVVKGDAGASPLLVSMALTNGVNQYYSAANAEVIRAWIAAGAARYGAADSLPEAEDSGYAGISACANHCHSSARKEWLDGPHGNREEMDASHQDKGLGLGSLGFPAYGYGGLGEAGSGCSVACHDPLGDGQQLAAGITGNVPRPVVGCESCHGAGGDHLAIADPKPGPERCGLCHNAAFDHNRYHPEGDNIIEDYSASPHASSINTHTLVEDVTLEDGEELVTPVDVRALCARCHTDEGAKQFLDTEGGHDALAALFAEDADPRLGPVVENASPVQCRTCHDKHNPWQLLKKASTDAGGAVVQSAEYRTCTNCHQTADAYHGENSGYSWEGAYPFPVGVGAFDGGSIIYDTHFDDPTTPEVIEGYVLQPATERVCRACHNVHAADTTINRQWARSRHGGQIATAKAAAAADPANDGAAVILQAGVGVDEAYGAAWVHYPWTDSTRSSCVQCHTATGAAAYLADPAHFDVADAGTGKTPREALYDAAGKFPHIVMDRVQTDTDARGNPIYAYHALQKEVLYCWGCHANNSGTVRNPGALTIAYPGTSAGHAYPDLGDSNVCVTCHAGRESGEKIATYSGDFTNTSFVNSHYLPAAAVLFTATGYEYDADGNADTDDYANVAYFGHDSIGMTKADAATGEAVAAAPGTGTSGPCVGCHLKTAESHLFRPLTKDANGAITAVASTVCVTCHDGGHGPAFEPLGGDATAVLAAAEFLAEEKAHYASAVAALGAQLAAKGFPFLGEYPYFAAKNWLTDSDGDGVGDVAGTGPHNLGAAYNFNLLHHEPGGYAHNRFYAKRLIYDSIDWLDDNDLNDSVAAALVALDDTAGYKAGAIAYLVTGFTR